jgi:hypothetical protein
MCAAEMDAAPIPLPFDIVPPVYDEKFDRSSMPSCAASSAADTLCCGCNLPVIEVSFSADPDFSVGYLDVNCCITLLT